MSVLKPKGLPGSILVIIVFLALSVGFWIVGQGGAVVAYDRVAALGLHPARDLVDPITVLVTQAIAVADIVIQMPFFALAILGLWRRRFFGLVAAWIGLGINLYWTTVAWTKQAYYVTAGVDTEPLGPLMHAALAVIFVFSAWASWHLYKARALFD